MKYTKQQQQEKVPGFIYCPVKKHSVQIELNCLHNLIGKTPKECCKKTVSHKNRKSLIEIQHFLSFQSVLTEVSKVSSSYFSLISEHCNLLDGLVVAMDSTGVVAKSAVLPGLMLLLYLHYC